MHLRHNLQKILIVLGVVLLGISISAASPRKSKSNSRRTAASSAKAHSPHRRATAHTNIKASAHPASGRHRSAHKRTFRKSSRAATRSRGQKAIDNERATEIQNALIRERYLDGKPSGIWDARTREAMVRYQSDNGWQTKVVPDSRALIKLGLGPNYANLLNAESIRAAAPGLPPQLQPGGSTAP